jgi:hypothetical protein
VHDRCFRLYIVPESEYKCPAEDRRRPTDQGVTQNGSWVRALTEMGQAYGNCKARDQRIVPFGTFGGIASPGVLQQQ